MASKEQFVKGLQFTEDYYHRNGITVCCEPGGFPPKAIQDLINSVYSDDATPFNHYFMADGKSLAAVDLNRDGQVDVISYFDDAGKLEREEMDSDFDGHFDWIDHYQDGVRVMAETDTDMDGRSNVYAYYVDGKIQRKERDSNGDGRCRGLRHRSGGTVGRQDRR